MKFRAAIGVLLLAPCWMCAQPFGNEWIDFNRQYLKFPVTQTGMQQLDYNILLAGFTQLGAGAIDPRQIQVFYRGKEQFVFIEGEQDGSIDPGDYLLVFGRPNDGFADTLLYGNANMHPNPYYSHFSDTAWYFLTWNGSLSNRRYKIQSQTLPGGRTPPSWVMTQTHVEAHSYYNEGERDFYSVSSPLYTRGEGWTSNPMSYGQSLAYTIPTPNTYTGSAPAARLRGTVCGSSNPSTSPNHRLAVDLGAGAQRLLDTTYNAYAMIDLRFDVSHTLLSSGFTPLAVRSMPLSTPPAVDRQCFGYASLRYAHAMDLAGESTLIFEIPASSDSVFLSFGNFSGTTRYIWDLDGGFALSTRLTGSTLSALAMPGNARQAMVSSSVIPVSVLRPVSNFRDGSGRFTDYSKLQPDSALLIITWYNLYPSALQYAAQRSGQGMDALALCVEDLYDQFSWGISKNPLAIRNFALYMNLVCLSKPSHLFLVGKGIKSNLARSGLNYENNRVPVMGVPPSDMMFTTPLDGSFFAPLLPVGRLVAHTPQQVTDYTAKALDKTAAIADASPLRSVQHWKKTGLHFAGGSDANEQNQLLNFLNSYKALLEDTLMGGKIFTFERFQSGATQNLRFDTIQTLINNGAALLSFFGHGSGGQLGIDIGDPSEYNNRSRYPLFVANSCNVGDFYEGDLSGLTINERWTLAKNSGVTGFISSTSVGYSTTLHAWNSVFFRRMSRDDFGASTGQIMQRSSAESSGGSFFLNRACLELNLHGDPSLQIYPRPLPDFELGADKVNAPNTVSVDEGSFDIVFTVTNLGRGIITDVPVEIRRQFPQGGDTTYRITVPGIPFEQKIIFKIDLGRKGETGENIFTITVNPDQFIDEIHPVVNNTVSNIRVNITSDEILPVYPYQFAIVPDAQFEFKAVCADLFRANGTYLFELDTTPEFASNALRRAQFEAAGSVISWLQTLPYLRDSLVYYWRCSPYHKNPGERKWRNSSFRYIPTREGWSQAHRGQFTDNSMERVQLNGSTGYFSFESGSVRVACDNKGNPANNAEYSSIRYSVNGVQQGRVSVCQGQPSVIIAIIDPASLSPWETYWIDNSTVPPTHYNSHRIYGNYNDPTKSTCAQRDRRFMFRVGQPSEMDSMIKLITQTVPDSFYILAHTAVRANFKDSAKWQNRHFAAFESLGADSIRHVPDDYPYIFFTQKGKPSRTEEMLGKSGADYLLFSTQVKARSGAGSMTSPAAGPALEWQYLSWNYLSTRVGAYNEMQVNAITPTGQIAPLSLFGPTRKFVDLRREIQNIEDYHYLLPKAYFYDPDLQSTPQHLHTTLYYRDVPELGLNPEVAYYFGRDTLLRGENLMIAAGISNLSHVHADSIRTKVSVRDAAGNEVAAAINKGGPLAAFHTRTDTALIGTRNLKGAYTALFEINPKDSLWQREKHHFNNSFVKPFFVVNDQTNPLIDVTFDGRRILDGDIVSARPEISIRVKDDNPFMLLDDTSLVDVWLEYPDKRMVRLPYFHTDEQRMLHFKPAAHLGNQAEIKLSPQLTTDGVYTLRTRAADVVGNEAGKYDYVIRFEVINRSTITHVMNYPNPFTTSTRFVYTLTGWKVPDVFTIQILNVGGRVVREIRREELGSVYIGRNISQYAWDGTDEFGDRLANGVYFYRVVTKIEGESIEHRSSGADTWFKKEFGKMYLMR